VPLSTSIHLRHRPAISSTHPRRGRLPSRALSVDSIRCALARARLNDAIEAAIKDRVTLDRRDRRLEAALDGTARLMAARPGA